MCYPTAMTSTRIETVVTIAAKPVGRLADGSTRRASELRLIGRLLRGLRPGQRLMATRVGNRITLRCIDGDIATTLD